MAREQRMGELTALKTIAETLNSSNDMEQMLHDVMQKLLQVTGLTTGWIFLVGDEPEYACTVDANLPPALTWGDKTPMCQGSCWCLDRYWDGRLRHAVNIIECKRIEDALEHQWGDTQGIVHHATVPLEAGGEWFGILNVGAPGKESFSDEELALLQSVAYQIGTAVKRTRLYHAQQKRAELFYKLDEVSQTLRAILDVDRIPKLVVGKVEEVYPWPVVALFMKEGDGLSFRALSSAGRTFDYWEPLTIDEAGPIGDCVQKKRPVLIPRNDEEYASLLQIGLPRYRSGMAAPIQIQQYTVGVLWVSSEKSKAFDEHDLDLLNAISDHIAVSIEHARLYEERQQLTRVEERYRLARDLHDSVSQSLFSLRLHARGAETMVRTGQPAEQLADTLQEMQQLAQLALKEMRSLIWQLRPAGLEEGLVTALSKYGETLGLRVRTDVRGIIELSRPIEEGLWRIGQEALNNVSKHAGVQEVDLSIQVGSHKVTMTIEDKGAGFKHGDPGESNRLGMISMRERASLLGGHLKVQTKPGMGTVVKIQLPLGAEREEKR
jgi:signal transduction histidine kinase